MAATSPFVKGLPARASAPAGPCAPTSAGNTGRKVRPLSSQEGRPANPAGPAAFCLPQGRRFLCRTEAWLAYAPKAVRQDPRAGSPRPVPGPVRRGVTRGCGCACKPRPIESLSASGVCLGMCLSVRCVAAALAPRLRPKRCWRWPNEPAATSLWPSSCRGAKPAAIIGWRVDGIALTWSDRSHRAMPREAWRGSAVVKVTGSTDWLE